MLGNERWKHVVASIVLNGAIVVLALTVFGLILAVIALLVGLFL
jgi:hypothetical protein